MFHISHKEVQTEMYNTYYSRKLFDVLEYFQM